MTDNRNRTATNVRTAVSKNGGNLGAPGAVSHAFDRLGQIIYAAKAGDPDTVFEAALEAGAADVESSDDGHEIWTAMDELHEVAKALQAKLGAPDTVKLAWRPQTTVTVGEGVFVRKFLRRAWSAPMLLEAIAAELMRDEDERDEVRFRVVVLAALGLALLAAASLLLQRAWAGEARSAS